MDANSLAIKVRAAMCALEPGDWRDYAKLAHPDIVAMWGLVQRYGWKALKAHPYAREHLARLGLLVPSERCEDGTGLALADREMLLKWHLESLNTSTEYITPAFQRALLPSLLATYYPIAPVGEYVALERCQGEHLLCKGDDKQPNRPHIVFHRLQAVLHSTPPIGNSRVVSYVNVWRDQGGQNGNGRWGWGVEWCGDDGLARWRSSGSPPGGHTLWAYNCPTLIAQPGSSLVGAAGLAKHLARVGSTTQAKVAYYAQCTRGAWFATLFAKA